MSLFSRTSRIKKVLIFSLVAPLIFFLLVETASRGFLFFLGDWITLSRKSTEVLDGLVHKRKTLKSRLENPVYRGKSWFSGEFLEKSLFDEITWVWNPGGRKLVLVEDQFDPDFTVLDGVRLTTGFQPIHGVTPKKLFILGGSTTFCHEVPNYLTWPSQLQRIISEAHLPIEVFNLGVTSVNSAQEAARLEFEIEQGRVPDLFVIYDGVNEITQGIYNGNPSGTLAETEMEFKKGPGKILGSLLEYSAFWKALSAMLKASSSGAPSHVRDEKRLSEFAREAGDRFEANILRALSTCRKNRIPLLVFLQPALYSCHDPQLSIQEKPLAGQEDLAGMRKCFEAGYPILRGKCRILKEKGVHCFDLSEILSSATEPLYLDFCHVGSEGNKRIAAAIFPHLLEVLNNADGKAPPSKVEPGEAKRYHNE